MALNAVSVLLSMPGFRGVPLNGSSYWCEGQSGVASKFAADCLTRQRINKI